MWHEAGSREQNHIWSRPETPPQKGAVLKQQSRRKANVSIVLAASFKLMLLTVFVAVKTEAE